MVKAAVPAHVVRELSRHTLKKVRWSRLLSPAQNWMKEKGLLGEDEELPSGEILEEAVTPLFESLVPSLTFAIIHVSITFKGDLINLSELKSIAAAERRCANQNPKTRPLIGGDSQVAVAAAMKGRFSSRILNDQLKCMLFDVITGRLSSKFFWVGSKLNPADDPTRGVAVRAASEKQPAWFLNLRHNPSDFSALDRLLCHLYEHADGPSVEELVRQHCLEQPGVSKSIFGKGFEVDAAGTQKQHRERVAGRSKDCNRAPNLGSSRASSPCGTCFSSVEPCCGFESRPGARGFSNSCPEATPQLSIFPKLARDSQHQMSGGEQPLSDLCQDSRTPQASCKVRVLFLQSPGKRQFSQGSCQSWLCSHPVLASIPRSRFLKPKGSFKDWSPCSPGVICLWGVTSSFSRAMLERGAPWVLMFGDSNDTQDLSVADRQNLVESLICEGSVCVLGAFPQCFSFSSAVSPSVRNLKFVAGVPHVSPQMLVKVKRDNRLNTWCAKLLRKRLFHNVRFWVGSPSSSFWWQQRCFRKLLRLPACSSQSGALTTSTVDLCRAGAPWRKRTKIFTDMPRVPGSVLCRRDHSHQILRGSGPNGLLWTQLARAWPPCFVQFLADLAADAAGFPSLRCGWDPAVSLCANVGRSVRDVVAFSSRGGSSCERKYDPVTSDSNHPFAHFVFFHLLFASFVLVSHSTRPRLPHRVEALPETRISSATAMREMKAVDTFQTWLVGHGIHTSLAVLSELPSVLDQLLKSFGRSLYDSGRPYSGFVYAITGLQNFNLRLKRNLPYSWDLAFIWRSLEPVVRRRPVDEVLVLAMVGVGASFGWFRFCGVLLLMFFGALRSIEPLVALRTHLVLPEHTLRATPALVYLKISSMLQSTTAWQLVGLLVSSGDCMLKSFCGPGHQLRSAEGGMLPAMFCCYRKDLFYQAVSEAVVLVIFTGKVLASLMSCGGFGLPTRVRWAIIFKRLSRIVRWPNSPTKLDAVLQCFPTRFGIC